MMAQTAQSGPTPTPAARRGLESLGALILGGDAVGGAPRVWGGMVVWAAGAVAVVGGLLAVAIGARAWAVVVERGMV